MNRESEILQKKYISKSNTVNNMKLIILEKIMVIRTCYSKKKPEKMFTIIFNRPEKGVGV